MEKHNIIAAFIAASLQGVETVLSRELLVL
jgi:hypothetical protein